MIDNPALMGAITFYGAAYLPKLRKMDGESLNSLCKQLMQMNLELPLHMKLSPKEEKSLVFPEWENGKQLTGPQTLTLMIFAVWCKVGENPENCSSLYETWPIREAVLLVDGVKNE